jgi:hypothetical protein
MQHLQPHRVSTIAAVTAAAMLVFNGIASAQIPSAGLVVNEGAEVQVTSAPIRTAQRYRAAQWLLDVLPDKAPNRDDEFIYGDDTAFLSIFWMSYSPIVMLILWFIGDWLMRWFRKLRIFFHSRSQDIFKLKLEQVPTWASLVALRAALASTRGACPASRRIPASMATDSAVLLSRMNWDTAISAVTTVCRTVRPQRLPLVGWLDD